MTILTPGLATSS